jgi:hypothetical protein
MIGKNGKEEGIKIMETEGSNKREKEHDLHNDKKAEI